VGALDFVTQTRAEFAIQSEVIVQEVLVDPTRNPPALPPDQSETPLDSQAAALLLEQTSRAARRQLDPTPPLLWVAAAIAVPGIYATLWLSVRGQHPYRGPELGVIGAVYIVVAILAIAGVAIYLRARAGVSGRSRREEWIFAIPVLAALIGYYTFVGALKYDGFSHGIVYGVADAAGPWLMYGAVLGAFGAAREDWWKLAGGVALIAAGAGAAFAGPINVWGILALASCVLLLANGFLRWTWARRQ
jgi:hypothetical protein